MLFIVTQYHVIYGNTTGAKFNYNYKLFFRVYFTPNRALSGLALVGLPGTEGYINVVSTSQIEGNNIILQIPFILSQCPLGYSDPPGASNISQVRCHFPYMANACMYVQ